MAVMKDETWARHANPWSGWTRVLAYVLLVHAVYLHNWIYIGVVVAYIAINPKLFSKPKSTNNWMSKSVMGEKIYTANGMFKRDFATELNLANVPFFVGSIVCAWMNLLLPTIVCTIISASLKLSFLNEMVKVYDSRKRSAKSTPQKMTTKKKASKKSRSKLIK